MWCSSRFFLGPLLFLIYINDFRICLNECSAGHSADDTFIMCHSRKPKTIETIISTELNLISNWPNLNKLSLNTGKTEVIYLHSHVMLLIIQKYLFNSEEGKLLPWIILNI